MTLEIYNDPKTLIESENVPGIILYVLSLLLMSGYYVQISQNAMRNHTQVLPNIDFAKMFINSFKILGFGIVWISYLILIIIIPIVLIIIIPFTIEPLKNALIFIIIISAILAYGLTFPAIYALFTKDFSCKKLLNPLLPFRLFSKVAGDVFITGLLYEIMIAIIAIISAVGYAFIIFFGTIKGQSEAVSQQPTLTLIALYFIFSYIANALQNAYYLKLADIAKAKLTDTKYLDSDYDYSDEEEKSDSSLDY